MRRKQNKGFTLAELLIVVAIVGVLVAIAIPVFAKQKLKAQEAVDKANLRAAYAEVMAAAAADPDHSWYVPVEMTHQGHANGGTRQFALAKKDETIGGINTSGINRANDSTNPTLYVVLYSQKTLDILYYHRWGDYYGLSLSREYGMSDAEAIKSKYAKDIPMPVITQMIPSNSWNGINDLAELKLSGNDK